MRAAQLLYGDTVGGAIVPVEEGGFYHRAGAGSLARRRVGRPAVALRRRDASVELTDGLPD